MSSFHFMPWQQQVRRCLHIMSFLATFAVSNLFSLRPLRLCGEESVYAACAQTVKTPLSFDLDSIFR
jgi:hypothetical protein